MEPIKSVTEGITGGAKSVLNVKNIVIIILTALVLYFLAKRFMKERIVLTKNADGNLEGVIERKMTWKKDVEENNFEE